ncbi:hypothetical protein [Megasphaera sueciensis]|uniref:hypothetical protein n=1 Tax=Megasphaera sueciensis TaxID=349094 RepID=UPI003D04EE26
MTKSLKGLVLCADGVATSTIVLVSIREACEEAGIQANFQQGRIADVQATIENGNYDVIVSNAGTDLDLPKKVPIFNGVPFLTGIGKEEVMEQIKAIADKK